MKIVLVENYQCDFCNQVFNKKFECENHEKEKHKCPKCKHFIKNERGQLVCDSNKCNVSE